MGDTEKRRAQKKEAAKRFRQEHPEKIKANNQSYYKQNQQDILANLRQKRIDQINPDGLWIHVSQAEEETDLPQSFNHVVKECNCQGRRCKDCEKVKCVGWFYQDKRRPDTFVTLCKPCYGKKVKAYKQSNQDIVDASTARYTAENKEKRRRYWLKRIYGITPEQYQEMYLSQGGCCALCCLPSEKTLHIDHNHQTGKVRALLCTKCNSLIGYSNESIERLERAIKYLAYHQEGNESNG